MSTFLDLVTGMLPSCPPQAKTAACLHPVIGIRLVRLAPGPMFDDFEPSAFGLVASLAACSSSTIGSVGFLQRGASGEYSYDREFSFFLTVSFHHPSSCPPPSSIAESAYLSLSFVFFLVQCRDGTSCDLVVFRFFSPPPDGLYLSPPKLSSYILR